MEIEHYGIKVKLLPHVREKYIIDDANPIIGSEWECEGTLTSITISGRKISKKLIEDVLRGDDDSYYGNMRVSWDNGYSNAYGYRDLTLVDTLPGCKSIW